MAEKRKKHKKHQLQGIEKETRRRSRSVLRPNAAIKEKERLRAFNEALKNLQEVIPIKLPEGRKLHKKQTLQFACRYIHFLRGCLDGTRDWSDRSRFWCESDEDYSMIDAIDAAAVATSNKNHLQLEKKARKTQNSQSFEKKQSPKFQIPPHYKFVSTGLNQGYWINQQSNLLRFDSQTANFYRAQHHFVSGTPPFYNLPSQNEFQREMKKNEAQPQVEKAAYKEAVINLQESNLVKERSNDEDHEASQKESYSFAINSENHDHLEEAWKDLSEIIF